VQVHAFISEIEALELRYQLLDYLRAGQRLTTRGNCVPMAMPGFSVSCECGNVLPVSPSQAGTQLSCACGRSVRVGRLSELRRAQGMDAAESSIRDTIARMIREGSLPPGACCAATGMPTDEIMLFDVHCEQSYVKGSASRKWGIALAILGFFVCLPVAVFMWLIGRDLYGTPIERVGRDVVITVPIRIARDSQAAVSRSSQSRLKSLLSSVPIYKQLLEFYPAARIHPRSPTN
jgi:hypothetical protein